MDSSDHESLEIPPPPSSAFPPLPFPHLVPSLPLYTPVPQELPLYPWGQTHEVTLPSLTQVAPFRQLHWPTTMEQSLPLYPGAQVQLRHTPPAPHGSMVQNWNLLQFTSGKEGEEGGQPQVKLPLPRAVHMLP